MCVVCVPQPCWHVDLMSSSVAMDPVSTAPNSVIKFTIVQTTAMKLAASTVSIRLIRCKPVSQSFSLRYAGMCFFHTNVVVYRFISHIVMQRAMAMQSVCNSPASCIFKFHCVVWFTVKKNLSNTTNEIQRGLTTKWHRWLQLAAPVKSLKNCLKKFISNYKSNKDKEEWKCKRPQCQSI